MVVVPTARTRNWYVVLSRRLSPWSSTVTVCEVVDAPLPGMSRQTPKFRSPRTAPYCHLAMPLVTLGLSHWSSTASSLPRAVNPFASRDQR